MWSQVPSGLATKFKRVTQSHLKCASTMQRDLRETGIILPTVPFCVVGQDETKHRLAYRRSHII